MALAATLNGGTLDKDVPVPFRIRVRKSFYQESVEGFQKQFSTDAIHLHIMQTLLAVNK